MNVLINGLALMTDGIDNWRQLPSLLHPDAAITIHPRGVALPAGERRRATLNTLLAADVAQQALRDAGQDPTVPALVFGSSNGDGQTIHDLCETLAQPERWVSPTRFHNSVHNAAAGYWSIAAQAQRGATSLACSTGTFAASLLEAATQCAVESVPVLLVVTDVPAPFPLDRYVPGQHPYGMAMVLVPYQDDRSLARLSWTLGHRPETTLSTHPYWENRRRDSASARGLPLVMALAQQGERDVVLPYLNELTLQLQLSDLSRCA